MKDYYINIFYSEDDEGYIADIPELKACSAFAGTPDQALGRSAGSQRELVGLRKSKRKKIPHPEYRSVIYQVA